MPRKIAGHFYFLVDKDYLLTVFANSAPALNLATFLAAILIAFPVCGFLPVLAALLATEKEPKPTNATLSPFLSAFVVALTNASKALPASAFVNFDSDAIASTNSALFIFVFLKGLTYMLIVRRSYKTINNQASFNDK